MATVSSSASDSSSERSESPSPSQSPEASVHGPPTLERLVVHFVAAKRSLSSTNLVLRANEIVTSSRRLIEEVAILNAQNVSAHRGIARQVDTLNAVRDGVTEAGDEADHDLEKMIAELDGKHVRLEKTLDGLRKVVVDAALHTKGSERDRHLGRNDMESMQESGEPDEAASDEPKNLYDFIDDSTHTDLLGELRVLLDTFQDSKSILNTALTSLSDTTQAIEQVLHKTSRPAPPTDEAYNSDDSNPTLPSTRNRAAQPPSLPGVFRTLESQAAETASLLHSLISHHDLCVTALKHTEGGGEAAKAAIQREQEQGALTRSGAKAGDGESSLYAENKHPAPISHEERSEMLSVLENDATELEDVVTELRDLADSLEENFTLLETHALRARNTRSQLQRLLITHLQPLRSRLPDILITTSTFHSTVVSLTTGMQEKSTQLSELTAFYAHFGASYKALLKEVERRKAVEAQMEKVASRARMELERLWEGDRERREEFVEEAGRFLPRDLWPELGREGRRWVIGLVGDENGEGAEGEGAEGEGAEGEGEEMAREGGSAEIER
ncbi:hypothetical protein MBLNU230_g6969t1 [Neophaeotheca triangularis]